MTYTKALTELSSRDVAITGGKGTSLGKITQAGIPVPAGFILFLLS